MNNDIFISSMKVRQEDLLEWILMSFQSGGKAIQAKELWCLF